MWLLGAGASASAGIPTAWEMVWEFKQQLFVHQRKATLKSVSDLANPAIRAQLQAHIDSSGTLPALDSLEEYATLFETLYPSEGDRRTYLDRKMASARPSYGHVALSCLMKADKARLVWTTNFDPLVADACAKVFDTTGKLTTIGLEGTEQAAQLIGEGRWPIEVKLHGDFRSRRLKNTSAELLSQDMLFRRTLVDVCRRFGLVAVGYSGRDESVMRALEDALAEPGAFPAGLFWLHKGEGAPLPRVVSLLNKALQQGCEAALVKVENFDEVLRDLVRPMADSLDMAPLEKFASERSHFSPPPRPGGNRGWPIVKLNGLPLRVVPTTCRRVVCDVGGFAETRAAMSEANVDVIVSRVRDGVLAFGSDRDIKKALEKYNITAFDLHTIEPHRLRYDSGERGLLRDALTRALVRQHGFVHHHKRSSDLLAPSNPNDTKWNALRQQVGSLAGVVPDHPELTWVEGISTRLDWADGRVWLLFEPRLVFAGLNLSNKAAAADFSRERGVRRYNRQTNDIMEFWSGVLATSGEELRALGIGDGIDAVFGLSSRPAYSRRMSA
ncbi:MAG: SIR2 family protein [Flavobacteriales bacterium]|nr:SIR2 family protein [Flavobacteriales bacterium]